MMPLTCLEEERAEVVEKAKVLITEFLSRPNHCFTAKSIALEIHSPLFAPWLIEDIVHALYANHDPCFAGAARYFNQRIYYFRAPDYVVQESENT
jgi:hypothetical protein